MKGGMKRNGRLTTGDPQAFSKGCINGCWMSLALWLIIIVVIVLIRT